MIVRTYTSAVTDVIAAYCLETGGCYVLTPKQFAGRRNVHLRVAPSLNNQQTGINWASDFVLEARLRRSWGHSSVGRASGWQPEGRRFEPGWLHLDAKAVDYFAARSSSY